MTLAAETLVNPFTGGYWAAVRDSDPRVVDLYMRHYSAKRSNKSRESRLRSGITGPAETMTLLTLDGRAVWVL